MLILFYFISVILSSIYSYNILPPPPKTTVCIHLEKFNEKYNLLHIGISFNNLYNNIRYDFRAFSDEYNIIDNNITSNDINLLKDKKNSIIYDNVNLDSKVILWGISNKTLDEIIIYEKTLHKKYILGIYDCRHYVNKFTDWCLDKPTPIWKLYSLWNKY